jgi:hypothetical protein
MNHYVTDADGVFLSYPDPKHRIIPTEHHIISDWRILCKHYGLTTATPALQPEIHFSLPPRGADIRVQTSQKDNWHGKKSWPYFEMFAAEYSLRTIRLKPIQEFVRLIAGARAVVCIEGGVSHVAKAVGTPAVVIFGGFASPRWSGYEDQVNITNKKECSYCYNPDPCVNSVDRACMKEILPAQVAFGVCQAGAGIKNELSRLV